VSFGFGHMARNAAGGVSTQQLRNETLIRKFLARETVGVLLPGRETAEQYARVFVQLKRAGTPVPDNDLWIAALALEHDLVLITRDRHFGRIPQVLLGRIGVTAARCGGATD